VVIVVSRSDPKAQYMPYATDPVGGLQPHNKLTDCCHKSVCLMFGSTGDGDAPDNASRFWRRLKKKTLPSDHLTHIKYSVLGKRACPFLSYSDAHNLANGTVVDLLASHNPRHRRAG